MTTHDLANHLLSRPCVEVVTPGSTDVDVFHPITVDHLIDANAKPHATLPLLDFAAEGQGQKVLVIV